ncbi:MAG: hypothetical protein FWF94_02875 [Oscillospiraceae bacterium]|nr:hypothetical protein [Oscillospiraceae bacterium]
MKKLLSLLLTAAMLCALTLPVLATTPADNAQTRNADIFDFIDILEDCVGMVELTPVEVYDHNKNGVVDIFDGIIVLEGIIGLGDCVTMPVESNCVDYFLSKELQQQIKQTFYPKNPDIVKIQHCFGIYDGSVALWFGNGLYTDVEWSETVAGYTFEYSSGQQILIWNNGVLHYLSVTQYSGTKKGAYELGLLTDEDVAKLYRNWISCRKYKDDVPVVTTPQPETTTGVPETTTGVPEITTGVPETTTSPETTTIPQDTTARPVLEGEIYFEVAEYVWLGRSFYHLPRENRIVAVNSLTEMETVFKAYEGESFYDADIDENVFADKTAIVFYLYNGSSGSHRTIINSLAIDSNQLKINATTGSPCLQTADIVWWRIVLLVNRVDLSENVSINLYNKIISNCGGGEFGEIRGECGIGSCYYITETWFSDWLESKKLFVEKINFNLIEKYYVHGFSGTAPRIQLHLIRSLNDLTAVVDELISYCYTNEDEYNHLSYELVELKKMYDDSYFKEKSIIIWQYDDTAGGAIHTIDSVLIDENKLIVNSTIKRSLIIPMWEMSFIELIEINNSDIPNGVTELVSNHIGF